MAPGSHFEVFPGSDEDYYRWRLKAANGEIVAAGEGYTTRTDAHRGIEAACRAVLEARQEESVAMDVRDIEA